MNQNAVKKSKKQNKKYSVLDEINYSLSSGLIREKKARLSAGQIEDRGRNNSLISLLGIHFGVKIFCLVADYLSCTHVNHILGNVCC